MAESIMPIPRSGCRRGRFPTSALLLLAMLLPAVGCSTLERYDDAVRIKPERAPDYQTTPNDYRPRDGRTLRGTVVSVVIVSDSTTGDQADTVVVFLDQKVDNRPENYERIPLDDVEQIGTLMKLPPNDFDNVNIFESFNETEQIPTLREVPVVRYAGPGAATATTATNPDGSPGGQDCGCVPFGLDLGFALPGLSCPERNYQWYFAELRGSYAGYVDVPGPSAEQGREALQGEVAAGVRFGASDEWGLGVAYLSGLPAFNSFDGSDASHPAVLGHVRYQLPGPITNFLGICLKPFFYGQLGLTIDDASVNLMRFNLAPSDCNECTETIRRLEAEGQLGDVDFSMPISFGVGAGIDMPISSFMDISADIGYRSLAVGEEAGIAGFTDVPSLRRINYPYLRLGVTF